jgi:hypothetical protein
MTPNWQDPEAAKWQVASLAAARRVTHLPLLVPRGVGSQATIYALPTYALLVYHDDPSGDIGSDAT